MMILMVVSFNTFRKPLNFILAIYDEEVPLKEAEFFKKRMNLGVRVTPNFSRIVVYK